MSVDVAPGSHHGLLTSHLVRLIEAHSEGLASGLLNRIRSCGRCNNLLEKVPEDELKQRVFEIYSHLGEWLESASDSEIERRYTKIGERRALQGVPFSEVLLAILATKEQLWDYVDKEALFDRAFELYQIVDLFHHAGRFFDRAAYFAGVGYEHFHAVRKRVVAAA
jgi:hypothetical protein